MSYYKKRLQEFSLNRTFYGIETVDQRLQSLFGEVLIVPFMELKRLDGPDVTASNRVLIVPFMELKLVRFWF